MRCTVAVAVVTKGLLIQNRSAPQPSSMTTADVQGDSAGDDALYAHEGEQGEFGYSSIPSNHNSGSGSTASQKDVFGIVLSFGRIQPIWQLNSLVCYRGMWQDDRERNSTRRDVVLTVATGIPKKLASLPTWRRCCNCPTSADNLCNGL